MKIKLKDLLMEASDTGKTSKKVAAELDKLIDSIPSIPITEKWGQLDSAERIDFEKRLEAFLPKGLSPEDRIKHFIAKVNGTVKVKSSNSVTDIFNRLVVMRTINNIVTGFSPSGAGFIFEALTAAIMGGKQEIEKDETGALGIADVKVNGKPYSMKLLSSKSKLKGSVSGLIDGVKGPTGYVTYIIMVRPNPTSGQIKFYSGVVDKTNLKKFKGAKSDPTQFIFTPNQYKINFNDSPGGQPGLTFLGELNVDNDMIRQNVKEYLVDLKDKIEPIYSALKDFTINLHQYFAAEKESQRKSAAGKAKQSSRNLDTQAQTSIN